MLQIHINIHVFNVFKVKYDLKLIWLIWLGIKSDFIHFYGNLWTLSYSDEANNENSHSGQTLILSLSVYFFRRVDFHIY